jgi:hypothetical protein
MQFDPSSLFDLSGWIHKISSFIATMAKKFEPPLKKTMAGKLALTTPEKTKKGSAVVGSLLVEMCLLVSTPSTLSSRSLTGFFLSSSPSSLFAVSKLSSLCQQL